MGVITLNLLIKYGLCGRFENEATLYPELSLARITAQYRGLYKIVTATGVRQAELSGKRRHETTELAKFPTVGDIVMISPNAGGNALIHHVLTRKSIFLRTAVGVSVQAQPVAANIDTVFLCMSLNHNFNLSRLERYLSVAWDSGATPVILLTKADLCADLSKVVSAVERVSSFSDILTTSAYDSDAVKKLAPYLKQGTTEAFIGSSGVGKSTLINLLLGSEILSTGEIGKADKGRHTTTGRELFPLPFGGSVIDTPGMRELGAESVDISKSFDDIKPLAAGCKFTNCTHTNEPGCEVQLALAHSVIDQRRLNSYLKLKQEAGYDGLNSKQIEVKKLERLFQEVGGMKKARKFAKEKRRQ